MIDAIVMPLIRGLCLQTARRPRLVIRDSVSGTIKPPHENILSVKLDSVIHDGEIDENGAARLLSEAFESWKFDHALTGADAAAIGDRAPIKLPSCAAISLSSETRLYWIAADIDTAIKRQNQRNAAPWVFDPLSPDEAHQATSAARRSQVVEGRVALVTGGAQGIGKAIVSGLANSGAFIYIADQNLAGANQLATDLNAETGRHCAMALAVDVTDEASVAAAFQTVATTTGGLDLIISNAGVLKAGSVLEQALADFKFVTDVNYTGFFLVAKHGARLLRRQNRTGPHWYSDIIQINSKSGLEGSNKNAAYAGGKFGGIGLVASFALELVEYRIKVNAVCPGNFFDGPLWSDPENGLFIQYLNTNKVPGARTIADIRAHYEAKIPMGRGCGDTDLLRAIYYIVEQQYETGQAVPVTGGQVMLH